MRVLSLFDGMSCGRIALERAGVEVTEYYASEIDKYAIQVAKSNYPDTKHIGSVTEVRGESLPKIDLLIGGSPCQGFSFAGNQLNFDDPRSALFFEYVRLKKELNPRWYLLENVKMSKKSQDVITGMLGVEPIEINSSLVSAQNRPRIYWTNIEFSKPEDRVIELHSILESDCREIASFKNCVRKNVVSCGGVDKFARPAGFAQIPTSSGYQDHKVGLTKTPCLRAGNSFTLVKCKSGGIRVATVTEWERLQTVPDGYTEGVSNTQRYKMLGNGWTVDVIAHIFKSLTERTSR